MNEIRPSQQPPATTPPRFDGEIDLVDLALALWRRKWVVVGVALLITGLAAVYTLTRDAGAAEDGTFSSIYEVPSYASNGQNERMLVEPAALEDVVRRVYLPKARQALEASAGSQESKVFDFGVEVSSPDKGGYLVLETQGGLAKNDRIRDLHRAVLASVSAHAKEKKTEFAERIAGEIHAVEEQIRETQDLVDSLRGEAGGLAEVALQLSRLKEKLSTLKLSQSSMKDGEVVALAQQSDRSEGISSALIVALGAILGLFAGLFAALMANFIAAARERLHGEHEVED
ncbi:Wzz/FepE/Etk N-terminal domain-containing protein [Guyparkeria hydrothermalis]|uniref:Wzz/FepE/Etk N-terminal domain-containing protein n=1 Tax=Guyparkeria hydrothermalis TaxID=923 RepID=UPI0020219EE5|nr:Wzz/FepE/Etk N-terminal domain-containing protein [Guyparkeria hydrothermalis]MCL7751327.1 Wzz/FepE/Etk N-terminal domain-containing protein [Guyparkeria hydrothermalis]